jgi:uncharacterized protein (DUF2236 family)
MSERTKPYISSGDNKSLWKVERERAMVFGRASRLLYEMSNSKVAEVVFRNAEFSFSRLDRTIKGNVEIIFGTSDEAIKRAKIINQAHQSNNANVSDLKRFVFMARIVGAVRTYDGVIGKLTNFEKDDYVKGITSYGKLLGVPEVSVPKKYDDVVLEYNKVRDTTVSESAVGIMRRVISPFPVNFEMVKFDGILYKHFFRPIANYMNTVVTKSILGAEMREFYGLSYDRRDEKIFRMFSGFIKNGLNFIPDKYRFFKEYLRWGNQ